MRPTITVNTSIYSDSQARHWLALYHCLVTPTKLGDMEITFPDDRLKLEFLLKFSQYAAK